MSGRSRRATLFEINDLGDDSFGVQIQLFDDEAFVTVPFWHTGAKAEACFAQIGLDAADLPRGGLCGVRRQIDRPLETAKGSRRRWRPMRAMKRVARSRTRRANRRSRSGRRSAEAGIGRRGSGIGTAPDSAAATRRISSCNLLLTSGNVCYRFLCGKKAIAYMARIALRTPARHRRFDQVAPARVAELVRRSLRRWPASAGLKCKSGTIPASPAPASASFCACSPLWVQN